MGGKVVSAPAYQGSSLGSNSDISQKYKSRSKQKSGQNTLARQKYTIFIYSLIKSGTSGG